MRIGQTSVVSFLSQLLASLLGFAATVYITQTLGGSVYGQYALVVAVAIWLQVFGLLGVETAVTQRMAATDRSGKYLAAGMAIVLAVFGLIAGIVFVFSDTVVAYLGVDVVQLLLLILLGGLGFSLVAAALSGESRVHLANLLQPLNVTVRSGIQIAAVATSAGLGGLLLGHAAGGLAGAVIGLLLLRTSLRLPTRETFRDIAGFARYSWLGKLGSRAFSSMDTIVLGLFVAPNLIGYYEAAWNLASILAVFGTAIAQSVFPEVGSALADEDTEFIGGALADATAFTGLLLFPGVAGAAVIGSQVMTVYGGEFARAGTVLVVLCLARLIYAFGEQFTSALNAVDRPDLAYRVNLLFVAGNVTLNVALVYLFGWLGAAVATTISAALTLGVSYRYIRQEIEFSFPVGELGRQAAAAGIMAVAVFGVRTVAGDRIVWTLALVGTGAAVYFSSLYGLSPRFRRVIRRNVPVAP